MAGEIGTIFFSYTWPIWVSVFLAKISFGSLKGAKPVIRKSINELRETVTTVTEKSQEVAKKEEVIPLPYDEVRKDNQPHLLDSFEKNLRGKVDTPLLNLFLKDGEVVTVAGLVCKVSCFKTKEKKETMATAVIEDPSGRAEITLYPHTWLAHPLDENDVVVLRGKVKLGKILVNSVEKIGEIPFV